MKRTYIDASVLIAAFRGQEPNAERALEILDDPDRKFVVSDYLRLEVLPKPKFHNRTEEIEFMQEIFVKAENITTSPELTELALGMASYYDLTAIDALHAGAAVQSSVDEFVTGEKRTKPLCRITEVNVLSIHS